MASAPGQGDQVSTGDNIVEEGVVFLKKFIYDGVCRDGDCDTEVIREQLGGEELSDPWMRDVIKRMRRIGDDLDGNTEVQRTVGDFLALILSSGSFYKAAQYIFSDGIINWGRVVMLFYAAGRLVIKALKENIPDIIRNIVSWTMDYFRDHVANWIREQGGWEGIGSYFGTPTWQTMAVLVAGVVTAALVIRKM